MNDLQFGAIMLGLCAVFFGVGITIDQEMEKKSAPAVIIAIAAFSGAFILAALALR